MMLRPLAVGLPAYFGSGSGMAIEMSTLTRIILMPIILHMSIGWMSCWSAGIC